MPTHNHPAIPHIPGPPIIGSAIPFGRDRLAFLLRMAQACGDIGQCRIGPLRVILLNSSALVHAALAEHADQFAKAPPRLQHVMRMSLGNGLLASDGAVHRAQRKLIAPAFQPRHLTGYAHTMTTYTVEMLDTWQHGVTINAEHDLWQLTLRIIAQTLFDTDVQHEAADLRNALTTVASASNTLLTSPLQFYLPLALSPAAVRIRGAVERLDVTVNRMIAERRSDGKTRDDLLSVLLRARDEETNTGLTDAQLRDEVMTLFLAGHETTAIALLWTLILLAQHPDVVQCLQDEVDAVLAGRIATGSRQNISAP